MKMKVRVRESQGGAMQKIGWVATGVGSLVLLAAAAMVLGSLPELKRYLKIETM